MLSMSMRDVCWTDMQHRLNCFGGHWYAPTGVIEEDATGDTGEGAMMAAVGVGAVIEFPGARGTAVAIVRVVRE